MISHELSILPFGCSSFWVYVLSVPFVITRVKPSTFDLSGLQHFVSLILLFISINLILSCEPLTLCPLSLRVFGLNIKLDSFYCFKISSILRPFRSSSMCICSDTMTARLSQEFDSSPLQVFWSSNL